MAVQTLVRFAELPQQSWANGLGVTTELVSFGTSGEWLPGSAWRLSVAGLDRACAFSALPGLTRTFLPVGSDVVLSVDGAARRVPDGSVIEFDGASEVALVGLDRPCRALNLMVSTNSAVQLRLQSSPADGGPPGRWAVPLEDGPGFAAFDIVASDRPLPCRRARLVVCDPA